MDDLGARRERLAQVAAEKAEQGHDVDMLRNALEQAGAEELAELAIALSDPPLRAEWPFVEPLSLDGIRAESDPTRAAGSLSTLVKESCAARIRTGFLGSVAGCILGKPVEFDPTLEELREALLRIGDWPLRDYISERAVSAGGLRRFHVDWTATVRERIRWAAPDDDINYSIVAMLALERFGPGLDGAQIATVWLENLPISWVFGPERTALVRWGAATLGNRTLDPADVGVLASTENPGEERCGAMIRSDVWGYAFPGNPERASELAWRDAVLTHRKTGVYASMFFAALVASAFVVSDPVELTRVALQYVPLRSRFHAVVSDCLREVEAAPRWESAYEAIHGRYGEFGHCRVFQETGTLINTLRFATSVGDGICIQVSQGNDTDSYGALAGAVLGVRFGPEGLDDRWIEPFQDTLRTTVATFHEYSLSAVADRMAALPSKLAEWREAPATPYNETGWMG